MRRLWGIIVLALVCFAFDVSARELSVVTFNVGNTPVVPKHKKRASTFIDTLHETLIEHQSEHRFYVLFFQEVFSKKLLHELQKVADQHGATLHHTNKADGDHYHHGLVTLTNIFGYASPTQEVFEPWQEDLIQSHHRGTLQTCGTIHGLGLPICLVNLHTTYTFQPEEGLDPLHQSQLEEIVDFAQHARGNVLMAGDFNLGRMYWKNNQNTLMPVEVIGKAWDRFTQTLCQFGFDYMMTDQQTFDPDNSLAGKPSIWVRALQWTGIETPYYGHIDHVFYRFEGPMIMPNLEKTGILFTDALHDRELSDHYAMQTFFDVEIPHPDVRAHNTER